jgi:hypothetical protein
MLDRKKSLQGVEREFELLVEKAKELWEELATCESKCQGCPNPIELDMSSMNIGWVHPSFFRLTRQWTKNICMVQMNKLHKEGPTLGHSSMKLKVFLFNFSFHKSGNFFGWKETFYVEEILTIIHKIAKVCHQKNINHGWDLNFKINLDFHGKCKIKTSVILEGHLYATHEFHLSTS